MKQLKILFFTKGPKVTDAEKAEVAKIRGTVCYRNAAIAKDDVKLEKCDGVAGAVPNNYKELPTFEEAFKKQESEIRTLMEFSDEEKTSETGTGAAWSGNS